MAPPTEPPTHITLRIKVPPGHLDGGADTFTIPSPIAVTTTIGGVRELIQTSVPSNPPPQRQRLLYFGRALVDNDQTVADALNIWREPSQSEYVVHLLVRGVENAAPAPAPQIATAPVQVAPQQNGFTPHFEQRQQHFIRQQQQVLQQQQQLIHHQQQALQQAMPHQQLNGGVSEEVRGGQPDLQGDALLAQAPRLLQEQMQADWRMPQVQAQMWNPYVPGALPEGDQTAAPPNAPPQQTPYTQQAPPNALPQQFQPNAPPVPGQPRTQNIFVQGVGPNGERVAVHHQQRFFQHATTHQNHLPPGANGPPAGAFGMPPLGMQNLQQPQSASSAPALDRAREQIAELRRLLEEVRAENPTDQATPEQNARIARMEEQARNINSYIDPLNLASGSGNDTIPPTDPARRPRTLHPNHYFNPRRHLNNGNNPPVNIAWERYIPEVHRFNARRHRNNESIPSSADRHSTTGRLGNPDAVRVPPPANPEDVSCYLLSDPAGQPQALLLTPQHGTFTGTMHDNATSIANLQALPPPPSPQPAAPNAIVDQARIVQARRVAANGNMAAVNPMALFLRHFWLLLRIMIFSYFLLGSNMGWRRPLALGAIALGFWLMRAGMLGDGGVFRGWWEEIVREGAAAVQPPRPAGAMPTPEELARRLMEERRRGESEWMRWGRERVRAVVLLLASLWPGVGEAFVRAREAEERRLAEEEVAEGRRREEEEATREAAVETEKTEKESNEVTGASGEQPAFKNQAVASDPVTSAEATATSDHAATAVNSSEAGPSAS